MQREAYVRKYILVVEATCITASIAGTKTLKLVPQQNLPREPAVPTLLRACSQRGLNLTFYPQFIFEGNKREGAINFGTDGGPHLLRTTTRSPRATRRRLR